MIEPTYVQLPQRYYVGLGTKFISAMSVDADNLPVIPQLWDRFIKVVDQIPNRHGKAAYGLVEMLELGEKSHKDQMFYIAAAEVSSLAAVPPDMLHRSIPPGKYACFTHKGRITDLGKTVGEIYGKWVPQSGVPLRPSAHIEVYDHRFDHASDASEMDIQLPV